MPSVVVLAGIVILSPGLAVAQSYPSGAPELPRMAVREVSSSGLELQIRRDFAAAELAIRRIGGEVVHRGTYQSTPILVFPRLSDDGDPLDDGTYIYELRVQPLGDEDRALTQGLGGHEPPQPEVVSDLFELRDGELVGQSEGDHAVGTADRVGSITASDVVNGDDLIVEGSICASDSDQCADGEQFLTPLTFLVNVQVKLKDNDPILWLNDTSSGQDDWVLRAHNGNLRIQNATLDRDAIFIEEDVRDNALVLAMSRVGLGTANPEDPLHLVHTDPTIRFSETDGLGASFRLRVDTVAGNRRFVIQDGETFVPYLSIDQGTGLIGLGAAPDPGGTDLREKPASEAIDGASWSIAAGNETMTVSKVGSGGEELLIRDRFDASGPTMVVQGSVQGTQCVNTSSREVKTGFAPLDPLVVMAKLAGLPVTSWRYRHEPENVRHIGPVAEDFQTIFGLGDGEAISTVDATGVLMAAVQGLVAENRTLKERLEKLERSVVAAAAD